MTSNFEATLTAHEFEMIYAAGTKDVANMLLSQFNGQVQSYRESMVNDAIQLRLSSNLPFNGTRQEIVDSIMVPFACSHHH